MNPLASPKCARRLLMALVAISGIFLTAGCGSSSSGAPSNPGGFGLGNLTGTYVFSSYGTDATTGDFLTLAGAFVADGKGHITPGTMDVVDPSLGSAFGVAVTGSYSVGTDGRGKASLSGSAGTFILDFVLTSTFNGVSSHGLVTEFDGTGTGSGTLDLQTALTGVSSLAGPYAFSLAGADSSDAAFAADGAFVLNTGGMITAGVEDFNAAGATYPNQTLATGTTITLGSGTGPGSITLADQTTSTFNLTFDVYPIDSTHLKLIETDGTQFLAGDAFTQTGASIPDSPMVFTMSGGITVPIAVGGLMNSDGAGNFTAGLEDYNSDGNLSPAHVPFSGLAVTGGPLPVGGRVAVTLTNFVPATTWVIYPSSGGLLMLEMDAIDVTQGVGLAQSATSFQSGTSVGYGLNLSGFAITGDYYVDDIAQFDAGAPATSFTGTPNMTGAFDENESGFTIYDTTFSGIYVPDPTATGRGGISVPTIATDLTTLNLEYYVANGSTILFIDVDSTVADGGQVAAGSFELQSSVSVAGVAHAHISTVHTRPSVRARSQQKK